MRGEAFGESVRIRFEVDHLPIERAEELALEEYGMEFKDLPIDIRGNLLEAAKEEQKELGRLEL